jgi:hypothetical protein
MPATSAARRNFEIIVFITFPCFLRSGVVGAQPNSAPAHRHSLSPVLFFFSQPTMEQSTLGALHKL